MVAFEPIKLELDDQKRSELRVLGEAESFVHVHLCQIDDDGAIRRRDIGDVDHPATLDWDRKRSREIRRLDHSPGCS
ncbi:hypothetical protein ANTQUA_LOCUS1859 [Anthophora quadrimaculata]